MKGLKLLFAALGLGVFGHVNAYKVVFKNSVFDNNTIVQVEIKSSAISTCKNQKFQLKPGEEKVVECAIGSINYLMLTEVLPVGKKMATVGGKNIQREMQDGKVYTVDIKNGSFDITASPIASQEKSSAISVKNISSTPVYVAVYEEFSGQNPRRFAKPILVNKGAIVNNVLRPEWSASQRLKGDRNLYIAVDPKQLPEVGRPYHSKDFVNVGDLKGKAFFVYGKEFDKNQHGVSFGASASEKDAQREQSYQKCLWMRDHSEGYRGTCTR